MVNFGRFCLVLLLTPYLGAQQKQLSIEQMALHQFEDGPVLAPTYEFVPGDRLFQLQDRGPSH